MKLLRLALAAALLACATPQSRIKKHRAEFDAYPPSVQRKILDGQTDVGFTKAQTALALGRPDRVYTSKSAGSEQETWVYGVGGGARLGLGFGMMSGGPVSLGTGIDIDPEADRDERLRVVFQDGVVARIDLRRH
jgi:hypothetical protein